MRLLLSLLLLTTFALTACRKDHKPDLPGAGSIVAPQVVYVDRVRYVAIPAHLTQEQPIAEGPLSQCPDVAASRKASLRKANGSLREIRAIQGTAVSP